MRLDIKVYAYAGGVKGTGGALAEYMLADAALVTHKPKSLTMLEAVALPLVSITAWEGLIDRARVPPGLPVMVSQSLKFCPQCWQPGTAADLIWTDVRPKYCFACGHRCAISVLAVMSQLSLLNFVFVLIVVLSIRDKAIGSFVLCSIKFCY